MSTMTGNRQRAVLWGLVGLCLAVVAAGTARAADVVSDRSAAIVIYPKIVVDTLGSGKHVDTEIQLTNTSKSVIGAVCYWVDGTNQCQQSPPRNFPLILTKRQPIAWKASQGLMPLPCGNFPGANPCFNGGSNGSSQVPVVPSDPFFGELRCVQTDPESPTFDPVSGLNPANQGGGDLKGEATIVSVDNQAKTIDARKYNAIGIEAIQGKPGSSENPNELILGGDDAQYAGCPNVILIDHMFEGAEPSTRVNATATTNYEIFNTDLTVIPCARDYESLSSPTIGLQFLVYNEFEQRFSTAARVTCWRETSLADIDTRPGNDNNNDKYSIFSSYVQGTLTGQTRMRSVADPLNGKANGVLAITEEFWECEAGICSDAGNVHFTGVREGLSDIMRLSPEYVPDDLL